MKSIFIVIPAYNEEKNIAAVIQDIKKADNTYHIVVVDDFSKDKTYDIVKNAGIDVLRHIVNRGQGAALKTGSEYAIMKGAEIIVHFDADNQFLASEIASVIEPIISDQADIVFGSRFMGKPSNMPVLKKNIVMPLAQIFQHFIFGIKMTDPQSGFRAFNAAIFNKINWHSDRMAHCSEILHFSFKNKLRVKEVACTVVYHDFGQKFSGGLKIIKDSFLNIFIKH